MSGTSPTTPTALVTGANRGIGFEIARQLGAKGLRVVVGARDGEKGIAAARRLAEEGLDVEAVALDVDDPSGPTRAVTELEERFGRLDVLVNNAAVALHDDRKASVLEIEPEILRPTLETNFHGPVRLCQAVVPGMRERGFGRIVNVSSGRGSFSKLAAGGPAYRLSKTVLNAFTVILADELRGSGVLVNAMTPGWVRTRLGGLQAPRDTVQGAETAVWLATLPDDGPHGGFFRDREVFPW